MTAKIYVSLVFAEEAINDELEHLLQGLGANSIWHKGETRGKTIIRHQYNGCAFKFQPVESFAVEDVVHDFWEHFKLENSNLGQIVRQYNLAPVLSIAIYVTSVVPSINFAPTFFKSLLDLNCEMDIDMILLSDS